MEDETNSRFGMGNRQRFYEEEPAPSPMTANYDSDNLTQINDEDEVEVEVETVKENYLEKLLEIDEEDDPLDRLTSNIEL